MENGKVEESVAIVKLKKKTVIRRVAYALCGAVFLVVGIVFSVLYAESREVENLGGFIVSYQTVTYNNNYIPGIVIGWTLFAAIAVSLACDFLFCGVLEGQSGNISVAVYRGLFGVQLYLNGKLADSIIVPVLYTYLEGCAGGVRVTASKEWFSSYHVTFSDGRTPVDI